MVIQPTHKRAKVGDQLTYLSWVLMWFEAMSRLKVNLDKSWLIPMGRVENAEELSQEFFISFFQGGVGEEDWNLLLRGDVKPLASLGNSTIGKWKLWSISF
ncbi:hypothetical protein CK203_083375 [Vitis vinifera]|uniref:Uncharacterized protein n=1 Tax=Vitis vinifera TaxID=29760 RepID=A0A438BVW4_VITVI|nr:hypothetical protein CK203_083375 [Vitis vinifera]